MGWFSRTFGSDTKTQTPGSLDLAILRPALDQLIGTLGNLAEAMDTPDAPLSNPGWRGRMRDLRDARADLRALTRKTDFSKDELYDVLTRVRPLFRGTAPKGFEHLAELNTHVAEAIIQAHTAAGS